MSLKAFWQAWQQLNDLLNDPTWIERERQVGVAFVATGNWLIEDANRRSQPVIGAPGPEEEDWSNATGQLVNFLSSQNVDIPMAAGDRREQLLELLKLAIPILLKLLVK